MDQYDISAAKFGALGIDAPDPYDLSAAKFGGTVIEKGSLKKEAPPDPSLIDVAINAANKGMAGVPDSVLNTPNRLLNLGRAAFGTAATALGRPDLAPDLTPDREYAAALLRKLGGIRQSAEPTTGGGRLLDATVQGAVGGAINPAASWGGVASNALMGATAGGVGDAVAQTTDNDALALSAGMLAPAGFANAGRLVARAKPTPDINNVLKSALASEDVNQVRARLQGATELVPGSQPMSHQVADSPALAQLNRTIRNIIPGGGQLTLRDQLQNQTRLDALDGISPVTGTAAEAANNAGQAMFTQGQTGYDSARNLTGQLYKAPELQTAALNFPNGKEAAATVRKFYPGESFNEAPSDLKRLVGYLESDQPVPLNEFDALRKIAGNRAKDLASTDRTASAAFSSIKGMFNDSEQAALDKSGNKFAVTGQGPWGDQFGNLAGDPQNAIAHLLRIGQGSVPDAVAHPLLGGIELAAGQPGKKATGLLHIESQGRDGALRSLPDLLQSGAPYSRLQETANGLQRKGGNPQVFLGDGMNEAAVRLDFDRQAKQWVPTAYEQWPDRRIQLETGRLANEAGLAQGTNSPLQRAGDDSLPDIDAAFKSFDQSLNPPVTLRDPRQYVGGLLAPDQAAALNAARAARIDQGNRFETGFAGRMWVDGHDGMPKLTGGEIPKAAFNNGATQTQDINQWGLMGRPGEAALKNYAITNLVENALLANGTLSANKANKWTQGRSQAIRGLLDTGEQSTLANVVEDAARAANAETLGRSGGSNTAQNLEGGALFSKPLTWAAGHLPVIGKPISALLEPLRNMQKNSRARQMQGLLLDPKAMADALGPRQYSPLYMPNMPVGGLLGLGNALSGGD